MELFTHWLLPCFWAFLSCVGFSLVFNLRGRMILWCSAGGAVGWLFYLITGALGGGDILQNFVAIVVIAAYAETVARIKKAPATVFLIVALIPLVPGGGIYYAMEYCIAGEMDRFLDTTVHTLAIAGVLALGILLVSSAVRMWYTIRRSGHL